MLLFISRISCLFFLISCLLLAACSSGPSKSDADVAINAMIVNSYHGLLPLFKENNDSAPMPLHAKISDLKCSKIGDDTFDCAVLFILKGETNQGRFRFTKLAGQWKCEAIK